MFYFRRKAATIASAPKTSSIKASEKSQLIENRYHATPNAINTMPKPIVPKAPDGCFGSEDRIDDRTSAQQPARIKTRGATSPMLIICVAMSSMATTIMINRTPTESIFLLLSSIFVRA